jgi:hypothetical protein
MIEEGYWLMNQKISKPTDRGPKINRREGTPFRLVQKVLRRLFAGPDFCRASELELIFSGIGGLFLLACFLFGFGHW